MCAAVNGQGNPLPPDRLSEVHTLRTDTSGPPHLLSAAHFGHAGLGTPCHASFGTRVSFLGWWLAAAAANPGASSLSSPKEGIGPQREWSRKAETALGNSCWFWNWVVCWIRKELLGVDRVGILEQVVVGV